jgi:glycerol uptake facilitator-like aquaporin
LSRLARRAFAEFLGTALLVATIVGSGIMAEHLAAGNAAIALLANSLATAAMLFVLITALSPISGAHLNPAVSLAFALRLQLTWPLFTAYIGAQFAGAIAGTLLAHAMFALPLTQQSSHHRTGLGQWLGEGIATAGLVFTIFTLARHRASAVAAGVALYIGAAYWFTSSTSFANPAVTIARSLTDTFSGVAPSDVLPFIAAQLAGALLGGAMAALLLNEGKTIGAPSAERAAMRPARSLRE